MKHQTPADTSEPIVDSVEERALVSKMVKRVSKWVKDTQGESPEETLFRIREPMSRAIREIGAYRMMACIMRACEDADETANELMREAFRQACMSSHGKLHGKPYVAHIYTVSLVFHCHHPNVIPRFLDSDVCASIQIALQEFVRLKVQAKDPVHVVVGDFLYGVDEFQNERVDVVHEILESVMDAVENARDGKIPMNFSLAQLCNSELDKDDELYNLQMSRLIVPMESRQEASAAKPAGKGFDRAPNGAWVTARVLPVIVLRSVSEKNSEEDDPIDFDLTAGMNSELGSFIGRCVSNFMSLSAPVNYDDAEKVSNLKSDDAVAFMKISPVALSTFLSATDRSRLMISMERIKFDSGNLVVYYEPEQSQAILTYSPNEERLKFELTDGDSSAVCEISVPFGYQAYRFTEDLAKHLKGLGFPVSMSMGDQMIAIGHENSSMLVN